MFIRVAILTKLSLILANNIIDVDDILSEDFMPGTLLMLENPKGSIRNFNDSVGHEKVEDGSFSNAMEMMGYHRSMMNQYLCRNYIAEEIINDMTLSRMKRRMGSSTPGIQTRTKGQVSVKNQLLQDEGSSGYKDWLSKSTTLEDIYRHYDKMDKHTDAEESDKDDEINEDYDGQITGYLYHQQQANQSPAKLGHSGGGGGNMYFSGGGGGYSYPHQGQHSGAGSGYQYGGSAISAHGGYGGHGAPVPEHEPIQEPPKYHIIHEESHSEKDHDLSDLFEIALTALAYLSFGMFIIHVIMCISMATQSTPTATPMMMPMGMDPDMTGGGMSDMGMTNTGGGTGTGNGDTGMGTGTGDGGTGGGTGTGNGDTGGGTGTGNGDTDGGTGTGNGDTGGGTGTGDGGTGGGTGTGNGDTGGGTGTGDGGTGGGTGTGNGDTGGGTGTGNGDTDGGTGTGNGNENTGTGADGGGTGEGVDDGGPPTGDGSTDMEGTATGTGTGTGGTGDGATGDGTGNTGAGTDDGTRSDTFKFRLKRDTTSNTDSQALNELARRVLASIEAAFVANEDDGNCLRYALCENNKYSRSIDGKDKIIIPIWSLGMSWLSGRLTTGVNPATSMLDTLKASILGLGKANCELIYQNCNLREQKRQRQRRRKRSSRR